jgi:hypothetical protein
VGLIMSKTGTIIKRKSSSVLDYDQMKAKSITDINKGLHLYELVKKNEWVRV